jgi:hypothetical protein
MMSPRRDGKPSALMEVLQSPRTAVPSLLRSSRQLGTSRSCHTPNTHGQALPAEDAGVLADVSSSGAVAAKGNGTSGNSSGSGGNSAPATAAESNPMLQSLAKVKANRVFRKSDSRVAAGAIDALLSSLTAPLPSRVAGLGQQQLATRKPARLPAAATALQRHNMEGLPAASFFDWDSAAATRGNSHSGGAGGFYRGTSQHSVSDGGGRVGSKHLPLAGELKVAAACCGAMQNAFLWAVGWCWISIQYNTIQYNTCSGLKPAPALASEPIVRS